MVKYQQKLDYLMNEAEKQRILERKMRKKRRDEEWRIEEEKENLLWRIMADDQTVRLTNIDEYCERLLNIIKQEDLDVNKLWELLAYDRAYKRYLDEQEKLAEEMWKQGRKMKKLEKQENSSFYSS